jgi:hypothetical protein
MPGAPKSEAPMKDEKMEALFKQIDAQITLREEQARYGSDRRRARVPLPAGQEDRRKGDRRSRARDKEKE